MPLPLTVKEPHPIQIGYEYQWDGWAVAVFDTRPGAMPDGEWSLHIEANALQMPQWSKALFEWEGPLEVTLHNGEAHSLPAVDEDWCVEKVGEMLVAVLKKCLDEGLFRKLPLASPCHMGVEHSDGAWGWPDFDEIPRVAVVNP